MKKGLLVLALLAGASQVFALSGFMKNALFVVKGSVKDFSDVGISETIADRSAAPSLLDLQPGDIFIDVNGNAQRVTKIVKSGTNISIETETPQIEEVFTRIRIPHQTTDFNDYGEDAVTYSPYLKAPSARGIEWRETDMLLDAYMPEGSKDYEITLNIPLKDEPLKEWTNKVGKDVDALTKMADNLTKTNDQKTANICNNMATQLQNKHATNTVTTNLDITLEVAYKKTDNNLTYDYDWNPLPSVKVNSWWPLNWSAKSGGGHVDFEHVSNFDFGMMVSLDLYIDELFSSPIPGLAYGSSSFGPYCGVYFDIHANGGFTFGASYWKHFEEQTRYKKEFGWDFSSRGNTVNEVKTWAPQAAQCFASLNAELQMGPAIKLGFVALGMKLVHANLYAGGYVEGEVCIGYTYVDEDLDNYTKLKGSSQETRLNVLYNEPEGDSDKWTPKLTSGCTSWGSFATGVFLEAGLEIWDGRWSTKPIDYKWPLLTNHGWTNSYDAISDGPASWFDTREGKSWFEGKH